MGILPGSGPSGSGPAGPGSGFSVMPFYSQVCETFFVLGRKILLSYCVSSAPITTKHNKWYALTPWRDLVVPGDEPVAKCCKPLRP